jgi:curved DNA-binding protein CbpA
MAVIDRLGREDVGLNRAPLRLKSSRTPRPSPGCDIRVLPIGPQEAFLFSRIDGSTSEQDLIVVTGFDAVTVGRVLDRLHELGAIGWQGADGNGDVGGPERTQAEGRTESGTEGLQAGGRLVGEGSETRLVQAPPSASEVKRPTALTGQRPEAARASDIDDATKQNILSVFDSLDARSFYELLDLTPDADRKELRKHYHSRAPAYHPDRFFGKELGPFKAKMEAIFGRLTLAYETLSDPKRRADYDAYLATQRETAALEHLLSEPVVPSVVPCRLSSTPSVPVPARSAALSSIPPRTPEEERARREALARKLGGGRASLPPDSRVVSSQPPRSSPDPEAAIQDLQRRREASAAEGQRAQARKYAELGRTCAADGNAAAAANAYRLALTFDSENAELARQYRQTSRLAAGQLAEAYLRQAEYEARNANWTEAARSYTKAAAGMPEDPNVLERAAAAIVRAGGDMHRAVEYAQRALVLSPGRVECRLLLAEIHLDSGRMLLARRELDAAREIAPQDDRIKELFKKLK